MYKKLPLVMLACTLHFGCDADSADVSNGGDVKADLQRIEERVAALEQKLHEAEVEAKGKEAIARFHEQERARKDEIEQEVRDKQAKHQVFSDAVKNWNGLVERGFTWEQYREHRDKLNEAYGHISSGSFASDDESLTRAVDLLDSFEIIHKAAAANAEYDLYDGRASFVRAQNSEYDLVAENLLGKEKAKQYIEMRFHKLPPKIKAEMSVALEENLKKK